MSATIYWYIYLSIFYLIVYGFYLFNEQFICTAISPSYLSIKLSLPPTYIHHLYLLSTYYTIFPSYQPIYTIFTSYLPIYTISPSYLSIKPSLPSIYLYINHLYLLSTYITISPSHLSLKLLSKLSIYKITNSSYLSIKKPPIQVIYL